MKRTGLTTLAVILLLTGPVFGQGPVQVVFTRWAPYGYMEGDRASGFEPDIVRAVMDILEKPVAFTEMPWKRCLFSVQNGLADAVVSLIRTPERETYLLFADEPISVSDTALFTTADQVMDFSGSLDALAGKVVGVTSGFSYGPVFDKADGLIRDEAITTEQVVRKLLAGRYSIAVGNVAVVSLISREMGCAGHIRFLAPLVHSEPLYVGFSKKKVSNDDVQAFSKALTAFKARPEYRAILARYGVSRPPADRPDNPKDERRRP
ncbi:transporter substrate-binding domain-containing protein [Desulfatiferula olefinivorans]